MIRMQSQFVTPEEFGAIFKLSKWSVYRLIKQGKIKAGAFKVGRGVSFRIPLTEVELFRKLMESEMEVYLDELGAG